MAGDQGRRFRAARKALADSDLAVPPDDPASPRCFQDIRLGKAFSLAQAGRITEAMELLREGAVQEHDAADALRGLIHLLLDQDEADQQNLQLTFSYLRKLHFMLVTGAPSTCGKAKTVRKTPSERAGGHPQRVGLQKPCGKRHLNVRHCLLSIQAAIPSMRQRHLRS